MKLYKFRPLATCIDAERVEQIINTGEFWHSNFWELNDPMEGVYSFQREALPPAFIRELFDAKSGYVICSFSGPDALREQLLWGYYANGFKGVAIEIDVNDADTNIRKVKYVPGLTELLGPTDAECAAISILMTKLDCWRHEQEHRCLVQSPPGPYKVGRISAVYFGSPYHTAVNANSARTRLRVREYLHRATSIRQIAKLHGVPCHDLDMRDGLVTIAQDARPEDTQT
jgi:hypothetical protein